MAGQSIRQLCIMRTRSSCIVMVEVDTTYIRTVKLSRILCDLELDVSDWIEILFVVLSRIVASSGLHSLWR